jgi:hypothetical protein
MLMQTVTHATLLKFDRSPSRWSMLVSMDRGLIAHYRVWSIQIMYCFFLLVESETRWTEACRYLAAIARIVKLRIDSPALFETPLVNRRVPMSRQFRRSTFLAVCLTMLLSGIVKSQDHTAPIAPAALDPLTDQTRQGLRVLYKQLIDAENRHDLDAVKPLLWKSPSMLFVAKTATPAEGNWAGFWGTDVVLQHFHDLYQGTFVMSPDYSKEKVVGLSADVAETYVPLQISVAYAGQTPIPKPFLMIVEWVRTPVGWKMATDIALPIPPPPDTLGKATP